MKKRINNLIGFSEDNWKRKKFKHKNKIINIATVFSGIGALEYAAKKLKLRHRIIFAGDIDSYVKKTYFQNYELDQLDWHDDIRLFDASKYRGNVDLLMGGSPCQSFSVVGKRLGLKDSRGSLINQFIKVVKQCQPKVFIFENVKGLINHDNGKTWKTIKNKFKKDGYQNIYPMILNSKDYGIPQSRERVFIVGFKDNRKKILIPKPIECNIKMETLLSDSKNDKYFLQAIDDKYYLKNKGIKFVTNAKNILKRYTQINGDLALCQKANQQQNWHGDFIFHKVEKKLSFDEYIFNVKDVEDKYFLSEKVKKYVLAGGTGKYKTGNQTDLNIARPLLATMAKMHRAGVDNYISYKKGTDLKGKIRKLTPEECFRLMGFRNLKTNGISDTQLYKQAGNSIVVDVIIAILKEMDITQYGR
jgi:DNA (cytosine-5)-methyltransferase 1